MKSPYSSFSRFLLSVVQRLGCTELVNNRVPQRKRHAWKSLLRYPNCGSKPLHSSDSLNINPSMRCCSTEKSRNRSMPQSEIHCSLARLHICCASHHITCSPLCLPYTRERRGCTTHTNPTLSVQEATAFHISFHMFFSGSMASKAGQECNVLRL